MQRGIQGRGQKKKKGKITKVKENRRQENEYTLFSDLEKHKIPGVIC